MINSLGQIEPRELSRFCGMHAFQRRRRRSHDEQGSLMTRSPGGHLTGMIPGRGFLFIGTFVFFVHHDEPEIRDRREHSRARTKNDTGGSQLYSFPRQKPLAVRHLAMQNFQLHSEMSCKKPFQLFGQRNFRDKTNRAPPFFEDFPDGPNIELAFTASGHTEKKNG